MDGLTNSILLFVDNLTVGEVVRNVAYWGLVPIMLLALVVIGIKISLQPTDSVRQQRRAFMGLVLGFLLATCAILLDTLDMIEGLTFLQDERKWLYGVAGFAAGFLVMMFVHFFLGSRTRALFVAPLVAFSVSSLYFYFMNEDYREPLLIFFFSLLVGAVLYTVIFDTALDHVLPEGDLT